MKKRPGGGGGYHNPYEWKKPNQPKQALKGQRKGYNV
jgi:hypothetical protein